MSRFHVRVNGFRIRVWFIGFRVWVLCAPLWVLPANIWVFRWWVRVFRFDVRVVCQRIWGTECTVFWRQYGDRIRGFCSGGGGFWCTQYERNQWWFLGKLKMVSDRLYLIMLCDQCTHKLSMPTLCCLCLKIFHPKAAMLTYWHVNAVSV